MFTCKSVSQKSWRQAIFQNAYWLRYSKLHEKFLVQQPWSWANVFHTLPSKLINKLAKLPKNISPSFNSSPVLNFIIWLCQLYIRMSHEWLKNSYMDGPTISYQYHELMYMYIRQVNKYNLHFHLWSKIRTPESNDDLMH